MSRNADGTPKTAEQMEINPSDEFVEADKLAWMEDDNPDNSNAAATGGDGEDDETVGVKSVPVAAHVKLKHKLKGKLTEQDALIQSLREENEQLKKQQPVTVPSAPINPPKRPRSADFGTDAEYEDAMDEYEEKHREYITQVALLNTAQNTKVEERERAVEQAVDDHYTRAEKLVKENNINPEVFKQTDITVKSMIESVMPKAGEKVFSQLVSNLGEGSEKTMFYLGRNKVAQLEFRSRLADDPTGIKAAIYLGTISERVSGAKNQTSQSPAPATQLQGDTESSVKGAALYRKWADAHGKSNTQLAYNLKKEARAKGIDTSKWR
jgi:hypothetical protein